MKNGLQSGFTLIEVMVATGVMVVLSAGALATVWRLMGIARDYVDETAADAYCHNVIYAADASSNRLDRVSSLQWTITTNELPRIVSVDVFGRSRTIYPLWRSQQDSRLPSCALAYTTAESSNLIVSVRWWDSDGRVRSRLAYATVAKEAGK